jgi:hypothetical protein
MKKVEVDYSFLVMSWRGEGLDLRTYGNQVNLISISSQSRTFPSFAPLNNRTVSKQHRRQSKFIISDLESRGLILTFSKALSGFIKTDD